MKNKKIKNKKIKLYILIIFTLFLFIENFSLKALIIKINFLKNTEEIKKNKVIKVLQKGKHFINSCLKHQLINKTINLIQLNKPIISVIIPVFNSENSIISSIRSIQNQNLSLFEIILVNDFSKDNTTKIIENLKKQDLRIKIIYN